jgi:hypothetical protein
VLYVLKVYTSIEGWACQGVFDNRANAVLAGLSIVEWVYGREDKSLFAIEEWELNKILIGELDV